jgi:hypothetical protein
MIETARAVRLLFQEIFLGAVFAAGWTLVVVGTAWGIDYLITNQPHAAHTPPNAAAMSHGPAGYWGPCPTCAAPMWHGNFPEEDEAI